MCLTLVGLIKIVEGVRSFKTLADELLAANAVAFLISSLLSYFAMKREDSPQRRRLGRAGDLVFSGALCLLVLICVVVAIQMI